MDGTGGEPNVHVDGVPGTMRGERAGTRSEEAVVEDPSSSASNVLSKRRDKPNDVQDPTLWFRKAGHFSNRRYVGCFAITLHTDRDYYHERNARGEQWFRRLC